MKTPILGAVAALIAVASAVPEINVQLEVRDNTRVRAVISNVGDETFKAITRDGLLSKAPIQKVHIMSQGTLPDASIYVTFETYCNRCGPAL